MLKEIKKVWLEWKTTRIPHDLKDELARRCKIDPDQVYKALYDFS